VPFLDHPLVEYLSSLPVDVKFNPYKSAEIRINQRQWRGINKNLLVSTTHDLLPLDIYTRPKMGFTFPFEKWLHESDLKTYKLKNLQTNIHWSRFWAKVVLKNWKL